MEHLTASFELIDCRHADQSFELDSSASLENVSLPSKSSTASALQCDSDDEIDLVSPPCSASGSAPGSPDLTASQFFFPDPVASFNKDLSNVRASSESVSRPTQRVSRHFHPRADVLASSVSQNSTIRAASERRVLSREEVASQASETPYAADPQFPGSFLGHRWTPVPSNAPSHLQPEADIAWFHSNASASTVAPHRVYAFPPPAPSEHSTSTTEPAWLVRTRNWISRPPSEFLPTDTASISGSRIDWGSKVHRPSSDLDVGDHNTETAPSALSISSSARRWLVLLVLTLLIGFHSQPMRKFVTSNPANRLLSGHYPGSRVTNGTTSLSAAVTQQSFSSRTLQPEQKSKDAISMTVDTADMYMSRTAQALDTQTKHARQIDSSMRASEMDSVAQCVHNGQHGSASSAVDPFADHPQEYRHWADKWDDEHSQALSAQTDQSLTINLKNTALIIWTGWADDFERWLESEVKPALMLAKQHARNMAQAASRFYEEGIKPRFETMRATARAGLHVAMDDPQMAARDTLNYSRGIFSRLMQAVVDFIRTFVPHPLQSSTGHAGQRAPMHPSRKQRPSRPFHDFKLAAKLSNGEGPADLRSDEDNVGPAIECGEHDVFSRYRDGAQAAFKYSKESVVPALQHGAHFVLSRCSDAAQATFKYSKESMLPTLEQGAHVAAGQTYDAALTTFRLGQDIVVPATQNFTLTAARLSYEAMWKTYLYGQQDVLPKLQLRARESSRTASVPLSDAARAISKYREESIVPAVQHLYAQAQSTSHKLSRAAAEYREIAERADESYANWGLEAVGLSEYLGFTIKTYDDFQGSAIFGSCRDAASSATRSIEQRAHEAGRLIRSSWLNSHAQPLNGEHKFATSAIPFR